MTTGRIYNSHFLSPRDTLGSYFVELHWSDLKGPIFTLSPDLYFFFLERGTGLASTAFPSTASGSNYCHPFSAKTLLRLTLTENENVSGPCGDSRGGCEHLAWSPMANLSGALERVRGQSQ